MSQGFIVKLGAGEPSKMHVLKGTFKCVCGANYLLYHHRAHLENIDEHMGWLEGVLKHEHETSIKHSDTYCYPL